MWAALPSTKSPLAVKREPPVEWRSIFIAK